MAKHRSVLMGLGLALLLVFTNAAGAQGSLLGGDGVSGIQIQNVSPFDASVRVDFVDGAGVKRHTLEELIPIARSANLFLPQIDGLPEGRYSNLISSNAELVVVGNTVNRTLRVGDSYLNPKETRRAFAPLVFRSHNNWTSVLYVQNASPLTQTVTFELFRIGEGTPVVVKTYAIPAYAAQEVDLSSGDFAAFGTGFGSATISAENDQSRVAVTVTSDRHSTAGLAAEMVNTQYRGLDVSHAGRELWAPLVFRRYNGWDTGVMVQNTGSVSTTVTITYTASPRSPWPGTVQSVVLEIGPHATGTSYLPAVGLPDRFYGGARISSSATDILAIINNVNYGQDAVGSSYEAFNAALATGRIAAPLIYRGHADTETGIQVQNIGNHATDITLEVAADIKATPVGGAGPWLFTATGVPPGGVATFYLPELLPAVSRLYGSATITSSGGIPIVAVVNSPAYPRGMSTNYAGINLFVGR